MRSPLNRTTGPQAIRLFDYCFKQGVIDACELEDDYSAKEFLTHMLETGGYGVLNEPTDGFDWKRWQFTLYRYCRYGRLGSISDTYIDKIHRFRNTFVFAILPIAMRFYLMGIEEWLEYPNPNNIALFKQRKKIHWKPMPQHLVTITTPDFISLVQQFVYERVDKAIENDLPAHRYNNFASALWRCNQKYPVYATDDEGEEIED